MTGGEIAIVSSVGGLAGIVIGQRLSWLRQTLDRAEAYRNQVLDAQITGLSAQISALDSQIERMVVHMTDRVSALDRRLTRVEARHDLASTLIEAESREGDAT